MQTPNPNSNEDLFSSLSAKQKTKRTNRKSSTQTNSTAGTTDDGTVSSKHSASTTKSDSTKSHSKHKVKESIADSAFSSAFEESGAMFEGGDGDAFFQNADFTNFASSNNETSITNTPTTFAFNEENASSSEDFKAFEAFDQAPVFSQPAEPEWDKSPLVDVPPVQTQTEPPRLRKTHHLKRPLLTEPVHDTETGNLLLAVERPDDASTSWIECIDPATYSLRSSFPLLTSDICQRVAQKYKSTVTKVHKIWCMTTGSNQVAVLLDAKTLGSSSSLRLIVGYHIPTGRADYVLTPPAGGDFVYNIATLAIAKKLVFLAGASPKGACVFLCRPTVRESWSANFLSGPGVQVTSLAASAVHQPWLAIGLTDQTVTLWMYSTASNAKRWLLPLCRLSSTEPVQKAKVIPIPGAEKETNDKELEVGFATHFCWHQPNAESLPLLSVAFENAVAIYSIQMPVIAAGNTFQSLPAPTPTTVITSTPLLEPLGAVRFGTASTILQCAWLTESHIAVLSQPSNVLLVLSVQWPLYQPLQQRTTVPLALLTHDTNTPTSSLVYCSENDTVCGVVHDQQRVYQLELTAPLSSSRRHHHQQHPVCSIPAGLDSLGDPLYMDAASDADGVLHVVCTTFCDRFKKQGDVERLYWNIPTKRFWLCRTTVTKQTGHLVEDEEDAGKHSFPEDVAGGAFSDVICELTQYGEPKTIVRSEGRSVCAVSFHGKDGIALVDFGSESAVVKLVQGRSLVFLPRTNEVCGLVLACLGNELAYFQWSQGADVKFSATYRPIIGVDTDEDYIECFRIALFSEGGIKVSLAAWGRRARDGRQCIISGEPCDLSELQPDNWSKVLANIVTGRHFWMRKKESIMSIVGLQGDGNGYRNFAVATSLRVMILTSALTMAVETQVPTGTSTLAPIGSFAMCFASEGSIRYLSCIDDGDLEQAGAIATFTNDNHFLLALCPDRAVLFPTSQSLVCNAGPNLDKFSLPLANLRPAFVLEPLVANAACAGGHGMSNPFLRQVVEKFGRMKAALAHGEAEGIGNIGVGLSSRVFSLLEEHKLDDAASWILTGTAKFDRASNTRILPPFLPMGPKFSGSRDADSLLHVLTYGDSYLADYMKSSEADAAATLPRRTDPSATLCRDLAESALKRGNSHEAVKLQDFSGSDSADLSILQLVLHRSRHTEAHASVLHALGGLGKKGFSGNAHKSVATSLSALSTTLRQSDTHELSFETLAPTLQRLQSSRRSRQMILTDSVVRTTFPIEKKTEDNDWNLPCAEAKHVWNEGPKKQKDNLLMLDRIGDWLGKCRPLILGAEGADAAADRGTKTLADILNKADDTFKEEPDDLESVKEDGFLDGVGEGRTDESNLSAYFRMSDGDGDESTWKSEGLIDISPYENRAMIVGNPAHFSLHQSTSSVDEGEPGKVKSLFDLVFDVSGAGAVSGLTIPAKRGGSLDIGLLHSASRDSRKKCSLEFWYFLPAVEEAPRDIVLARRTAGPSANLIPVICNASNKSCVLWELLLLKNGELEFRSCSGKPIQSSQNVDPESESDAKDDEATPAHLVATGRWNHVCLTFNSKGLPQTECRIALYMKGKEVFTTTEPFLPPGLSSADAGSESELNSAMQKSHLVFGLDHRAGFRMTEIRVWACERSSDDITSFLYEYLNAAEQKKKFKVKIANKNKKGPLLGGKGFGLAPPKSSAKNDGIGQSGSLGQKRTVTLSLAPPPKKLTTMVSSTGLGDSVHQKVDRNTLPTATENESADADCDSTGEDASASLWDTALPLSQQLRPSAAAALIRGPPATRHYGGNRGGLPDYSGLDRLGVGGIGICGSEKTVVFRDNEDPPAVTYPIGASGAVVSDQMDDEGSEFLCCFMAKEGRMVVFELRSRTVVVELQMTTKLNFWRYLPPEAAMNTLCFMLVTPVGGFHWMPLEETPRPHQVWKRGPELQGKKVVNYEEGGSNGLDGSDILSRVGLVLATRGSGQSALEGWILPITGDSKARQVSDDMLGACLCQPIEVGDEPFLPWLVTVHSIEDAVWVNVLTISEPRKGSIAVGDVRSTQMIDDSEVDGVNFEPPPLAMGTYPEALCVSLSNIVVVILRRKGLVAAFELEDEELNLIAQECVDHFVVDAVMRYSPEVGGAEIVMLLVDDTNPKDGRIVSFCFRSTT